jgi:hypothetical protein
MALNLSQKGQPYLLFIYEISLEKNRTQRYQVPLTCF